MLPAVRPAPQVRAGFVRAVRADGRAPSLWTVHAEGPRGWFARAVGSRGHLARYSRAVRTGSAIDAFVFRLFLVRRSRLFIRRCCCLCWGLLQKLCGLRWYCGCRCSSKKRCYLDIFSDAFQKKPPEGHEGCWAEVGKVGGLSAGVGGVRAVPGQMLRETIWVSGPALWWVESG